jgi:UDP:flavonoid glycosyltransferase YjiC (YdhE family)
MGRRAHFTQSLVLCLTAAVDRRTCIPWSVPRRITDIRVLFTSTGGDGHLLPLLPLARAFAMRGDGVAIAAPVTQRARIAADGVGFRPLGPTPDEIAAERAAHNRRVMALPPHARRPVAFSGLFAGIHAPRRIESLLAVVRDEAPDLLVYESADLAAPIAAAAAGVAAVHHSFGRPIPPGALRAAAPLMAPLWHAAGLKPDALAGAYRGAYVDICPPALREPLAEEPARVLALRPVEAAADSGRRARPRVYVTLGTIFNEVAAFRLLLDPLGAVDCDVVMTVGRDRDPAELAPLPANATVARYIPQADVLPSCDAVVAHGGSGSVLAALAHARPLVLLPQGADQFDNAAACAAAGVAEVLLPTDCTAARVREAVERVLISRSHAAAARAVADEIAAMPSPAAVAAELAAWASTGGGGSTIAE